MEYLQSIVPLSIFNEREFFFTLSNPKEFNRVLTFFATINNSVAVTVSENGVLFECCNTETGNYCKIDIESHNILDFDMQGADCCFNIDIKEFKSIISDFAKSKKDQISLHKRKRLQILYVESVEKKEISQVKMYPHHVTRLSDDHYNIRKPAVIIQKTKVVEIMENIERKSDDELVMLSSSYGIHMNDFEKLVELAKVVQDIIKIYATEHQKIAVTRINSYQNLQVHLFKISNQV